MSTLFNGNKRVKMDINDKTFFQFWFHIQHHTDPSGSIYQILELQRQPKKYSILS